MTRTHVTIHLGGEKPSAGELRALRRCVPRFRDTPPAELRASIGGAGLLSLGEIPTQEARPLVEALTAAGLDVRAENVSSIGFLPVDRTAGCAWLIEDDTECRAVAKAMIAAGVPVQEIEG